MSLLQLCRSTPASTNSNRDHFIWRAWIHSPCKSELYPIDCKSSLLLITIKYNKELHYCKKSSSTIILSGQFCFLSTSYNLSFTFLLSSFKPSEDFSKNIHNLELISPKVKSYRKVKNWTGVDWTFDCLNSWLLGT